MIRRAACRVIGLAVLALLAGPAAAGGQVIKVTLLGTGAPPPTMERFGPSILVEAGEDKLLFDAGRGMLQRLFQVKAPLKDLRMLFLTHLHSDHVVGLPDFWLTAWLFAGRAEPTSLEFFLRAGFEPERAKRIVDHHVTAEQAGEV